MITGMTPLMSVVVPVWNDAERLSGCLDAIMNQSLPHDQMEVIVVDNGSTDESHAIAGSYPGVLALREPRPGSYNARNRGLAAAKGTYVAFTDSDCIPDAHWLENAVARLRSDNGIGVVAGRVELFEETPEADRTCLDYEQLFAFDQATNARRKASVTANWVSRLAVLEEIGGFDGELRSGGDFALSRAIARRGMRVVYAPECVVRHPSRGSFAELSAKIRRRVGGRWARARRPFRFPWAATMIALGWCERTVLLFRRSDFGIGRTLNVAFLNSRLVLVAYREIFRLVMGGEPQR